MIATVLDTGPIVAALNPGDRWHSACAKLLTELAGRTLLPSPVRSVRPAHVDALTLLP